MFWECHAVPSSIDKLLDQPSESWKLQDFLDESDLIQECLSQNQRLIDYLVQANVMNELIGHVIQRPTDDNFRNAYVVSELLSGDFPRLQEALLERTHLDHFYSFLLSTDDSCSTASLNPILASYFSRILMTLIIRKPAELFTYFKSRPTFQEDFLRHLDTTSISDVLYRLIADCADHRTEAIQWYEEINLIDGIIETFLATDSIDVQINAVNILSEFLRLAFDQQITIDNNQQSPSSFTSSSPKSNEKQDTPLTLAQRILSKKNLEALFETMAKRPKVVAQGCDLLVTLLDLLTRSVPGPSCISAKQFFLDEKFSVNYSLPSKSKEDIEDMQINDEATETDDHVWKNLHCNSVDPLIRIYLTLIDVIPSSLPSLISLLSIPSAPLISSSSTSSSSSPSHDSSQTVKYQFISEPLGSMRLNLIKFFTKFIYLLSNDYTGDHIYQIFNTNQFLHVLIDLFQQHIYNNFLHTQVYSIIRLILQINALAVKQPDDIWTRLPFQNHSQSVPDSTNRHSYQFLQTLLNPSEVNLIERLLDQYELNLASNKSITTSSSSDDALTSALLHARFSSPNSGHVVQILRCLRDHAATFSQYSTFMKNDEQSILDDNTSIFEIRWQTALDYLAEDEKKSAAMHQQDRNDFANFRLNPSSYLIAHIRHAMNSNDSSDTSHRRQTFHMRSFGSTGAHYIDDDDDDEDENEEEPQDEQDRFDIDDESMNQERKIIEIKKISFEPPSSWHPKNNTDTETENDDDNHRMQNEKSSTTESNFEQLCSLRANDHGSRPLLNGNEEEYPDEF